MTENANADMKNGMDALMKMFGSRFGFLAHQLWELATTGQPCDVTLYRDKPHIDVRIMPELFMAMAYRAGPKKMAEMLQEIRLSDGSTVGIQEIWTINPMPKGGFTKSALEEVNLSKGEAKTGPNGETLRQMIRETYRCQTKEEEDKYIRRFIAS